MGYPALAEKGVVPVFDEIISQKLLKNNIFAFYVGSNPEMTMGYYDKSKFKGDIHWSPIEFKYMYGIKLDDFKVNGKKLNICDGAVNCLMTVDSGSSMHSFPSFMHKKFESLGIPADGKPAPCKSASDFGDLVMVIGGKDYIIPNSDWVSNPGLIQK